MIEIGSFRRAVSYVTYNIFFYTRRRFRIVLRVQIRIYTNNYNIIIIRFVHVE